MSSDIRPFTISVPDSEIAKLKDKLALARFADPVDFSDDWNYGVPRSDMQRLAKYWHQGFNWRKAEAKLNETPQFTTDIAVDGFGTLDLHFVHQKSSKADNSIPLLFCHGWPGSFIEVFKMLPLLTEPSAPGQPSFHLVAPSLPNFGFSQGPSQPGFGLPQYAEVCHKLMLKLGYDTYVTQGGDWGFFITRLMGSQYPAHCLATHVNMVAARPPSLLRSPLLFLRHLLTPYSAFEVRGLQRSRWFDTEGRGYYDVQSTRPATLGFALADSPVALLAWIYEKLHDWTDSYPFTDDEVLTWIAIYQFSRAGPAASVRIYYEALRGQREPTTGAKTSSAYHDYNGAVKFGASLFPADLILPPTSYIRTLGPLGFYRAHDRGGHFAAYEVPELLVDDLRSWFGKGGDAESIARTLGLKL